MNPHRHTGQHAEKKGGDEKQQTFFPPSKTDRKNQGGIKWLSIHLLETHTHLGLKWSQTEEGFFFLAVNSKKRLMTYLLKKGAHVSLSGMNTEAANAPWRGRKVMAGRGGDMLSAINLRSERWDRFRAEI